MTKKVDRRSVVRGIIAVSAGSAAVSASGASTAVEFFPGPICTNDPLILTQGIRPDWATTQPAKTIRKSAETMTDEEIGRFKRAFEYAVSKGYFDLFCDEHNNHNLQHNHGAELDAVTPIRVSIMPPSWGLRLLPWHRAFILEGEAMLRAALRRRNKQEGVDEREADLVFMPYWDVVASQKLPTWVENFQPKGGTAPVVAGLPKGHAGYGLEVGSRYNIRFGRWPGSSPGIRLPTEDDFRDMMSRNEFVHFVGGFDTDARIIPQNVPKAQAAVSVLENKLKDEPSFPAIKKVLGTGLPSTLEENVVFFIGLFKVHWRATHLIRTDPAIVGAVNDMFSALHWGPHAQMHLFAGGIDPNMPDVRGTVTYFNELCVDPAFWMIHGALDYAWYTWERAHPGKRPPLEGNDRFFSPITETGGAWYGGGRFYTLDDLTDHEKLPYSYAGLPNPQPSRKI